MTSNYLQDQNPESERLSMADALKKILDSHAQELRVSMPAIVEKYDYKKQTVDVRPVFQRQNLDGQVADMPIIRNVPVAFPRAGNSFLVFPIEKGHYVLLIFADRSLDKFLSNGGKSSPDDSRTHDVTDAIAFAGCYPKTEAIGLANATDLIIKHSDSANENFLEFRLKKNGHFQALNNQYELLKVLTTTIQYILEAKIFTSSGPQSLQHAFLQAEYEKLLTFVEG